MPTKLPTPTPEIASKYQIVNGKFLATPKNDPKDRITIEIGDTKQEVFYPQIKIQRWDGEVNLSVRLKEDIEGSDISFEKGKIVWSKENLDASFYDIEPCEEHPEGGYEFDITLYKKPVSNKIEFTLQDKDVDYFYQPFLTQEYKSGYSEEFKKEIVVSETQVKDLDGNVLVERPENVIGSYAVYAKTPKTNWTGGKLYRTGKVGHIFRPKIKDSAGTETWGILNIDKGILSIEIPQDFLDKAVYPIRHAAGLEFGYHTQALTTDQPNSDTINATGYQGTPASAGTVNTINFWGYKEGGTDKWKGILILVSDKKIVTNGVSPAVTLPTKAAPEWSTSTYSTSPSVTVVAYYIGWICQNGGTYFYRDTGNSGDGIYDSTNNYTTPTNPTDATSNAYRWGIYATYTASLGIALTGTVAPTITEANVVAGGKTIILTVTGDVWVVAAGGLFDAQRQNIINGLDSAQAEATGWDAEVKAKEVVTAVVRTSNTVVTITLTAQAGYNITATETITATVPGTALLLGTGAVATPTFTVTATAAGTNMQINIGDTFKTVASLQININDTWKDVSSIQENVGDTWRTVF